jgi:hypothetical protein
MVKSEMVVLTGREKADVANADVAVGWILEATAKALVVERKRGNRRDVVEIDIEIAYH